MDSLPARLRYSIIVCVSAQIVQAATMDLNDTTMWNLVTTGIGPQAQVVSDSLLINIPADSHQVSGVNAFSAGVQGTFSLHGDFTVDMDYSLLTWPSGNGVRIGIGIAPWYASQRVSQVWLGSSPGEEAYVFGAGGVNGVVPTSDLNGTLRLCRAGNLLGGYYSDSTDGNWVTIGTGTVWEDDVQVGLFAWSDDRFFDDHEVDVKLSNVRVAPEALITPIPPILPVPVPEAAGSLMTLALVIPFVLKLAFPQLAATSIG